MTRRFFTLMAVVLLSLPTMTLSQDLPQESSQPQLPYRLVSPHPGDSKKVLIFVSFTCPVCADYQDRFVQWARSMPHGWTAEFVPVVQADRDSLISGRAFYAAKAISPYSLATFMSNTYSALQNRGMRVSDASTWDFVASASHLAGFHQAWKSVNQSTVKAAYAKLVSYKIDATPSVVIGGKYVITPDNTNGDKDLFFRLANGMISKAMTN